MQGPQAPAFALVCTLVCALELPLPGPQHFARLDALINNNLDSRSSPGQSVARSPSSSSTALTKKWKIKFKSRKSPITSITSNLPLGSAQDCVPRRLSSVSCTKSEPLLYPGCASCTPEKVRALTPIRAGAGLPWLSWLQPTYHPPVFSLSFHTLLPGRRHQLCSHGGVSCRSMPFYHLGALCGPPRLHCFLLFPLRAVHRSHPSVGSP